MESSSSSTRTQGGADEKDESPYKRLKIETSPFVVDDVLNLFKNSTTTTQPTSTTAAEGLPNTVTAAVTDDDIFTWEDVLITPNNDEQLCSEYTDNDDVVAVTKSKQLRRRGSAVTENRNTKKPKTKKRFPLTIDWRTTEDFRRFNEQHLKYTNLDDVEANVLVPDTIPNQKRIRSTEVGGTNTTTTTTTNNAKSTNQQSNISNDFHENLLASRERKVYCPERLNEQQKQIFDAIIGCTEREISKGGHIILIQAGPGTGKTFTLMTAAHYLLGTKKELPHVVSYKNDLINKYRHCTAGLTITQLFIHLMDLKSLAKFKALSYVLNRKLSVEAFINQLLQSVRQFVPRKESQTSGKINILGNVIFLEEYTVMEKQLLQILLTLVKLYNLRLVACGDINQLGCILNSQHTKTFSSYDIIKSFADETFTLTINKRCSDQRYNEKINFISYLSKDEPLDLRGNVIVASMFHKHLLRNSEPGDTLIASRHADLAEYMYKETLKHKYPRSFYILEQIKAPVLGYSIDHNRYLPKTTGRYMNALKEANKPEVVRNNDPVKTKQAKEDLKRYVPGKFLPYTILCVGFLYYYNIISESSLCILRKIFYSSADPTKADYLEIEMVDEQLNSLGIRRYIYNHANCRRVIIDPHYNYLTNDGNEYRPGPGNLINFPIYPKFYMTAYACQGCTISTKVSFDVTNCTYQALYVLMSRVTSPSNINRVVITKTFSHLISILMNFDVVASDQLNVAIIESAIMLCPYTFYKLPHENPETTQKIHKVVSFILDESIERKKRYEVLMTLRGTIKKMNLDREIIQPLRDYVPFCVKRPSSSLLSNSSSSPKKVAQDSTLITIKFMVKYNKIMTALVRLPQIEASIWLRAFLSDHNVTYQLMENFKIFNSDNSEYDTSILKYDALFRSYHKDHSVLQNLSNIDISSSLKTDVSILFVRNIKRIIITGKKSAKRKTNFQQRYHDIDDDNLFAKNDDDNNDNINSVEKSSYKYLFAKAVSLNKLLKYRLLYL